MSEVTRYGSGERGIFKLETPQYKPARVNTDMLGREIERGEWRYDVAKEELIPFERKRADVAAPFVITDEMDPILSMTGSDKVFTSKARLRREYKEGGWIETGGQMERAQPVDKEKRRQEIRESVAKAMNDNKYGMAPMSELEKENSKREERIWTNYVEQRKRAERMINRAK